MVYLAGKWKKNALCLLKQATDKHLHRLIKDGGTCATYIRKKGTILPIDVQNAMSRGDKKDLREFLAETEDIPLLPEFSNLTAFYFRKAKRQKGEARRSTDALMFMRAALQRFLYKICGQAGEGALLNSRCKVNECDVQNALSRCSRTLL